MATIRRKKGRVTTEEPFVSEPQSQGVVYAKPKKPLYKRPWFIALAVLFLLVAVSGGGGKSSTKKDSGKQEVTEEQQVADAESDETEEQQVADAESDETEEQAEQEAVTAEEITETQEEAEAVVQSDPEPEVPREYQSALSRAKSYSSFMHMSKQGIYDQLTSEYGDKFTAEAAQYAVDNLQADYNANALAKAKNYQNVMSMSPSAIYDQLVSEYGERFTPEEAQYAVDHLND